MNLRPVFKEFNNDNKLIIEVNRLKSLGTKSEDMYVLAHDEDRTNQLADRAGVSTLGVDEVGIKATLKKLFMKKGDELRNSLEQIGFTQLEAKELEDRLDNGKVFLIVESMPANDSNLHLR